jgi:hypothetical protein
MLVEDQPVDLDAVVAQQAQDPASPGRARERSAPLSPASPLLAVPELADPGGYER